MKIAFKLPMAEDLAAALCAMGDADAGVAFKAALAYMASGEACERVCPQDTQQFTYVNKHERSSCSNSRVLPAAAQDAFVSMRRLIDLSRKRAQAGKVGSGVGGQDTRFAPGKQGFVPSKAIFAPGKQEEGPQSPDGFDVLSGLDAFLQ